MLLRQTESRDGPAVPTVIILDNAGPSRPAPGGLMPLLEPGGRPSCRPVRAACGRRASAGGRRRSGSCAGSRLSVVALRGQMPPHPRGFNTRGP